MCVSLKRAVSSLTIFSWNIRSLLEIFGDIQILIVFVVVSSIVREIWHVIVIFVKKAGCHWFILRTLLSLNFSGRHQEVCVY